MEIPSVGRILVRSDADGYDEEVPRRVQGSCVLFLKRRVSRANVFSLNQATAMEACLLLTLLSFMKRHG